MFIIKPLTTAVDIQTGANNVSSSVLVSVLNTGNSAVKITSTPHGDSNYSSASEVYIGAGAVSYTHLTLPTSDLV